MPGCKKCPHFAGCLSSGKESEEPEATGMCIEKLVDAGADLEATDNYGETLAIVYSLPNNYRTA